MNSQRLLLAKLILAKSNFQVLHWKCTGIDFDTIHAVTNKYYDMANSDLDDVAEILMRQNINPLNYEDVCKLIPMNDDGKTCIPTDMMYNSNTAYSLCDKILTSITSQIIEVLRKDDIANNPANIGIKSYYEGLLNEYDKELRFLNARRKGI
jgi:DNA-binding ferritin-like protein